MINDITGLVVSYRTKNILQTAIESVQKFYPELNILLIDGSPEGDPCREYAKTFPNVLLPDYNIGHGKGMHEGILHVDTKHVLIFDSDVEMHRGGIIEDMLETIKQVEWYGIGETMIVDNNGENAQDGIKYLHPYFMLIDKTQYLQYREYFHHGAPCLDAMIDIDQQGKSFLLKSFPVEHYVEHKEKGTRNVNPPEFLQNWGKPKAGVVLG